MEKVVPILNCKDLNAALEFYRDLLGFNVRVDSRDQDGKPTFASLSRAGVEFRASQDRGDPGAERARELRLKEPGVAVDLYINVDDVDAEYRALTSRGVRTQGAPEDRFWGERTFTAFDPDGYRLTFAQRVPEEGLEEEEEVPAPRPAAPPRPAPAPAAPRRPAPAAAVRPEPAPAQAPRAAAPAARPAPKPAPPKRPAGRKAAAKKPAARKAGARKAAAKKPAAKPAKRKVAPRKPARKKPAARKAAAKKPAAKSTRGAKRKGTARTTRQSRAKQGARKRGSTATRARQPSKTARQTKMRTAARKPTRSRRR